jgi:hypothetical protein
MLDRWAPAELQKKNRYDRNGELTGVYKCLLSIQAVSDELCSIHRASYLCHLPGQTFQAGYPLEMEQLPWDWDMENCQW